MNLRFLFFGLWQAVVDHLIPLTALLLLGLLVPRVGRLVVRIIESRLPDSEEATKSRLALVGALIYVLQVVAYFILVVLALANLGVPPLGAALPATVVSAAVGFGSQKIIGDFLAGFFIISEKQFGVGDYVAFDGTANATEGTVVALTLRTTKIRTPSGEVVMVPNGSAGVVTNFSQDWSRAVVNMAVPVRAGENLSSLLERVEQTSKEAIKQPAIAPDVTGEVEVLPATGVIAPTAAGLPWQINFRVLVVVNPARQWAVERGIRSALLDEFWDRYDLHEQLSDPLALESLAEATDSPAAHGAAEARHRGGTQADAAQAVADDTDDAPAPSAAAQAAATPTENLATAAVAGAAAGSGARPATAETEEIPLAAADEGPGTPTPAAGVPTLDADGRGTGVVESTTADDDEKNAGYWRNDSPEGFWGRVLSVGGRVRQSTTLIIIGLLITGTLALASSNPEDGAAGWLSPAYWREREPQSATPTSSTVAPTDLAPTAEPVTPTETEPTWSEPEPTPDISATQAPSEDPGEEEPRRDESEPTAPAQPTAPESPTATAGRLDGARQPAAPAAPTTADSAGTTG